MTSNRTSRSILRVVAAGAAWLLTQAAAHAATAVHSYQDMASGRNGDPLTAALMNASTHPDAAKWVINGPWFVSTRYRCRQFVADAEFTRLASKTAAIGV
jgi:hypothetical protein